MRLGGRLNDFQKLLALRDSIVISGQNANVHIETARGFLRGNCLLDLIVVRVVRERYEESQALHGNALTRIIARLVITRQVTTVTGAGNAIFVAAAGCIRADLETTKDKKAHEGRPDRQLREMLLAFGGGACSEGLFQERTEWPLQRQAYR